jgi:hypothetical protein
MRWLLNSCTYTMRIDGSFHFNCYAVFLGWLSRVMTVYHRHAFLHTICLHVLRNIYIGTVKNLRSHTSLACRGAESSWINLPWRNLCFGVNFSSILVGYAYANLIPWPFCIQMLVSATGDRFSLHQCSLLLRFPIQVCSRYHFNNYTLLLKSCMRLSVPLRLMLLSLVVPNWFCLWTICLECLCLSPLQPNLPSVCARWRRSLHCWLSTILF